MEPEATRPAQRRWAVTLIIVLMLVGLLVVVLDGRQMGQMLAQANWALAPVALLFTAASYLALSANSVAEMRAFGIRASVGDLLGVGFVSAAMNNLITAGGVTAFSIRYLILRQKGAASADITAASLFDGYVGTLGLLALLPVGLGYLYLKHPLGPGAEIAVGVATLVMATVFLLVTALMGSRQLRQRLLGLVAWLARSVVRKDIGPTLAELDETLTRGVNTLRARPWRLAQILLQSAADWGCCVATLGLCFDAFGEPLTPGVLVTGFGLGIAAGLLSMIPGGLGVQEGSMAGIYKLLGVPLEHAVLAAMLFRVIYYFVPFLLSLPLYGRLLHQGREPRP